jgi:hypothetical protein
VLAPYSKAYEKLLASCRIQPADLSAGATSLAKQVTSAGGQSFSSLAMLQAFARRVAWTAPPGHARGADRAKGLYYYLTSQQLELKVVG